RPVFSRWSLPVARADARFDRRPYGQHAPAFAGQQAGADRLPRVALMKARCMLLMALVAASAAARPQPARSVSRPSWAALPISAMPELPAPSAAPSSVSAD